jgi:hypothetical protein
VAVDIEHEDGVVWTPSTKVECLFAAELLCSLTGLSSGASWLLCNAAIAPAFAHDYDCEWTGDDADERRQLPQPGLDRIAASQPRPATV